MQRNTALAVCIFFLVVFPGIAAAEEEIDITQIGPQVGEIVPGFSLPDQEGRERSLESLMGPDGLVLVFFRSADW